MRFPTAAPVRMTVDMAYISPDPFGPYSMRGPDRVALARTVVWLATGEVVETIAATCAGGQRDDDHLVAWYADEQTWETNSAWAERCKRIGATP